MTSTTIGGPSTTPQTIAGDDDLTVTATGSLTPPTTAIIWDLSVPQAAGGVVVTNSGPIEPATGDAIASTGTASAAVSLTLNNQVGGFIQAPDHAVHIDGDLAGGSVSITNQGNLGSGGTAILMTGGAGPLTIFNQASIFADAGFGIDVQGAVGALTTITVQDFHPDPVGANITGTSSATVTGGGIRVSGLIDLTVYGGTVQALGASASGLAAAVQASGGTITVALGDIVSTERGIVIDDGAGGAASAGVSIRNGETISGPNGAIVIVGDNSDFITNFGTIDGGVSMGGGDDTFNHGDFGGASFAPLLVTGLVDGGDGFDIFNAASILFDPLYDLPRDLPDIVNFEQLNILGGSWRLVQEQSYGGGVDLAGTLELAARLNGALGFHPRGDQILIVDKAALTGTTLGTVLYGFDGGDRVILSLFGPASGASLGANNFLTVDGVAGAQTVLEFDASQDFTGYGFITVGDGAGGTVVKLATVVTGSGAPETINGGAGDQILIGLGGKDYLNGGDGDDVLIGGAGPDRLNGGAGIDTASYAGSGAGVNIKLSNGQASGGDAQSDTLTSIENIIGSDHNDTVTGTDAANMFIGGGGDDALSGGGGDDVLFGQEGVDILKGEGGDDIIDGGAGSDLIIGGMGGDHVAGGSGADVFRFSLAELGTVGTGFDHILDFSGADGDRIDLSLIDARPDLHGNQAFTWLGTGTFSHHAGELHYALTAGGATVSGDIDGDGLADFTLLVDGVGALSASDFVL